MKYSTDFPDCVVVGGGPAGMMCAGIAAGYGKNVILVEKNRVLGRKLLITGKGRCNVTNKCSAADFEDNIRVNSSFIRGAYADFDSDSVMDFFESRGVPLKVERGGRVFPVSDKASDIAGALEMFIRKAGVRVIHGNISHIMLSGGAVAGVRLGGETIRSHKVVIATGGLSYPATGSTGDGYKFASEAGHTIITPKASLVPVEVEESGVCAALQGLSLKNVSLKLLRGGKSIYEDFGEMLFTHFGLSGPIILSMSASAEPGDTIRIDLKPALDDKTLYKRICSDFEKYKNKNFANSLNDLLPNRLISVIISMSGISPYKKVNSVTRQERVRLVELIKGLTFSFKKLRPISEAIITAGGVCVKEISPSDMQSRIVKGLYFIGEVLDLDAYTGGFNLQLAFSTAYRAGKSIGKDGCKA